MAVIPKLFWFSWLIVISGVTARRQAFIMDEHWICGVKTSCVECLKLSFCSWCQVENQCYSHKLPMFKDFCDNSTVEFTNYGLSIEENSRCSCASEQMEQNCHPPGVTDGVECSDRGTCVCGRCVCHPTPVTNHPTKMVMGEFCEFDNFSCDGPKCNEGPYHMSQLYENDGSSKVHNPDLQSLTNNDTSI